VLENWAQPVIVEAVAVHTEFVSMKYFASQTEHLNGLEWYLQLASGVVST
jgi:hypothetical protein